MKKAPRAAILACVFFAASVPALASETPQRQPAQSSLTLRLKAAEAKAQKLAESSAHWSVQMDKVSAQLDAMLAKIRDVRSKLGDK